MNLRMNLLPEEFKSSIIESEIVGQNRAAAWVPETE